MGIMEKPMNRAQLPEQLMLDHLLCGSHMRSFCPAGQARSVRPGSELAGDGRVLTVLWRSSEAGHAPSP